MKVAATSDYDCVPSSVVDARSSITSIEVGKILQKRPMALIWLFKKPSQSSVEVSRSTHTSPGLDSDPDGSDSDDGYTDDDPYSDYGSESDSKSSSGSDLGEDGD